MSASRAALWELMQTQTEPTGLAALVTMTGLHANTVREHLEALRREGLVRRSTAPPAGRGRPSWLYAATTTSPDEPRSEYAGLAVALATIIARTSSAPAEDARAAGVDWGRGIAATNAFPPPEGARAARLAVSDLFARMGFAPVPDQDVREVRLTRCPLLEAAHQQPEIVCAVHAGIAVGASETYGAPPDEVGLVPFAEPGACLLRLGATT